MATLPETQAPVKPETFGESVEDSFPDLPPQTKRAIDEYVQYGHCGDFLEAVLRNNFVHAVCRADEENLAGIKDIAKYVWNHIPHACWGSPEKVKTWKAARLAERLKAEGVTR